MTEPTRPETAMSEPTPSTSQRMTTGRRTLLQVAAASGASIALSAAAGAPWAQAAAANRRVYVLVTDGLRPDEINPSTTPNLAALRSSGIHYPNARSLPIMETIPNHVMMMTGVRPNRSGVPANKIYDRAEKKLRDVDRPTDITYPTIIERLNAAGLRTGTVLSKDYLYTVFGERATYRWEPKPLMPITDHAPDGYTYDALIAMVQNADPHLAFVNFGDIDRVGHADLGGSVSLPLLRWTALNNTDRLIGKFVDHLKSTGKWATSTLIILADHSMDWSRTTNVISMGAPIWFDTSLRDKVVIAQNGGAELFYWTGPASERSAGLARLRELLAKQAGVLSVHSPSQLSLGKTAGDLVAFCKQGWRFSDPSYFDNPIPGSHGHPTTEPIPFLIAGGVTNIRAVVRSGAARTIDVAPTVGAILGVGAPSGGYDGVSRL